MARARRNVDLGGICLEKREEKEMRTLRKLGRRMKKSILCTFGGRKKKKDSVMQLPSKWKKTQERKEFQEAGAGPLCHVMQRG